MFLTLNKLKPNLRMLSNAPNLGKRLSRKNTADGLLERDKRHREVSGTDTDPSTGSMQPSQIKVNNLQWQVVVFWD